VAIHGERIGRAIPCNARDLRKPVGRDGHQVRVHVQRDEFCACFSGGHQKATAEFVRGTRCFCASRAASCIVMKTAPSFAECG
jgi:hypothetical protein